MAEENVPILDKGGNVVGYKAAKRTAPTYVNPTDKLKALAKRLEDTKKKKAVPPIPNTLAGQKKALAPDEDED